MTIHPIPSILAAAALAVLIPSASPALAEKPVPPGTTVTTPRLKEFEKTLQQLSEELVKIMKPDAEGMIHPGEVAPLIARVGLVDTGGLPEELAAAYKGFAAYLEKVSAVFAGLPAELKMTPEGRKALSEKDPAAAERVKEIPARLEACNEEGLMVGWKLEKASGACGINLLPFIDPDYSGKTAPVTATGLTTPEKFSTAILALPDKQYAMRKKLQGKTLLMGDVAELVQGEAALLYAIPVDGLPDEVAASFSRARRSTEKHGWALKEMPADMAAADAKTINAYVAKRKQTEPDFDKKIIEMSRRVGAAKKKREEHTAHFRNACEAAGIKIGTFMQFAAPAGGDSSGAKEKASPPGEKPAKKKQP